MEAQLTLITEVQHTTFKYPAKCQYHCQYQCTIVYWTYVALLQHVKVYLVLVNQGMRKACSGHLNVSLWLWLIVRVPFIHNIPRHKLDDCISFYFSHVCVRGFPLLVPFLRTHGAFWENTEMFFCERKNLWKAMLDTVLPQNKIKKNRWVYFSEIQNILSCWQDFGLDVLCFSGCAATLSSPQAKSWWGLSHLTLEGCESALLALLAASQLVRGRPCWDQGCILELTAVSLLSHFLTAFPPL